MSADAIELPPVLAGRRDDVQRLVTLVQESAGALLVTAPPLRGLSELLWLVELHLERVEVDRFVRVDARRATGASDLARLLSVGAVAEFEEDALNSWELGAAPATRETIEAYRRVMSAAEPRVDVDSLRGGVGEGPRLLEQAFYFTASLADGERAVVIIDHADAIFRRRFDRAPARQLSGALRSSIQEFGNLQLILAGHQDGPAQRALESHDDPLFRAAQLVAVPPLSPPALANALLKSPIAEGLDAATVNVACDIAAGVPSLTLELLGRVRTLAEEFDKDRPGLVLDAYLELIQASRQRLALTIDLARELHRLGPAIMQSLAVGSTPYQLPESSKIVFEALRRLQDAGLIWQPGPRVWAVTDPLVRGWLRGYP